MSDKLRKQITIEGIEAAADVMLPDADLWVTVRCRSSLPGPSEASFVLVLKQKDYEQRTVITETVPPGEYALEAFFGIKEVLCWQPNVIGEASVYELMAGVRAEGALQDVASKNLAVCDADFSDGGLILNGRSLALPLAVTGKPLSRVTGEELRDMEALGFGGLTVTEEDCSRDACLAAGLAVLTTEPRLIRIPRSGDRAADIAAARSAGEAAARALAAGETIGIPCSEATARPARYFVARALAPLSLFAEDGAIRCLNRTCRDFAGMLETEDGSSPLRVSAFSAETVSRGTAAVVRDTDNKPLASLYAGPSEAMPRIFISAFRTAPEEYRLAVASDGNARCVELTGNADFSDNYFTLLAGESREIAVRDCPDKPDTACRVWDL
ncbi:MAG: hypothetical protein IK083_08620 [Abditibacteriota bacterium]|nr:hypothetical protein [Abditibacteriota bacterium]